MTSGNKKFYLVKEIPNKADYKVYKINPYQVVNPDNTLYLIYWKSTGKGVHCDDFHLQQDNTYICIKESYLRGHYRVEVWDSVNGWQEHWHRSDFAMNIWQSLPVLQPSRNNQDHVRLKKNNHINFIY